MNTDGRDGWISALPGCVGGLPGSNDRMHRIVQMGYQGLRLPADTNSGYASGERVLRVGRRLSVARDERVPIGNAAVR